MAEGVDIAMTSEETRDPSVKVMYQLPSAFCRNPIIRCIGGWDETEARWMGDTAGRGENGRWTDDGCGAEKDKRLLRREGGRLIMRDGCVDERDNWPNTDETNVKRSTKRTCERPPIKRIITEWKAEIAQKKLAKKRKMDEAIGQSVPVGGVDTVMKGGDSGVDSSCGGGCGGEIKLSNPHAIENGDKPNVEALKTEKQGLKLEKNATHISPPPQKSTPDSQHTAHSTLASLTAPPQPSNTPDTAGHSTPDSLPHHRRPNTASQHSISLSNTALNSTSNTVSLSQLATTHSNKNTIPSSPFGSEQNGKKNSISHSTAATLSQLTAPNSTTATASRDPNTQTDGQTDKRMDFSSNTFVSIPQQGIFSPPHPHGHTHSPANIQTGKRTDLSLSQITQMHLNISNTPNTTSVCSPTLSSLAALHLNTNANPNVQNINIPPLSIPRFSMASAQTQANAEPNALTSTQTLPNVHPNVAVPPFSLSIPPLAIPNTQTQANTEPNALTSTQTLPNVHPNVAVPPFSLSIPPLAIPNTQTGTKAASNTNTLTNARPNASLPPFPLTIPPFTIPNTQIQTNADPNVPTNANPLAGVQTNVQTDIPPPLRIPPLSIPNTQTETNVDPNAATEEDAFEGLIEGMEWSSDSKIDLQTALVTKKAETNTATETNTDPYRTPPPPIIEQTHTHTNALTDPLLKRTPSPFGLVIAGFVPGRKQECPVENVIRVPFSIFRFDSPSPDELVEMAKNDPSNPSRYKLITFDRMTKR